MGRRRKSKTLRRTSAIPYLPDNVIEKILSFLPINLAAQATTVSKQWAPLWPSFPVIVLDERCYSEPERFLHFLRHSLRRCKDQKVLDKLRIRASLAYGFQEVSEWIDFAVERCVKELDVQDLDTSNECKAFYIDIDVMTLKSITSLKLENVGVSVSDVSLPLLKTMSLKNVHVEDDSRRANICPLIAGCPCIEHLSFVDCFLGVSPRFVESNSSVSSNSLKSLEFLHCYITRLSVSAKNLESFTFYSDYSDFAFPLPYLKNLSLWKCDNLIHVDIFALGLEKLLLRRCLNAMNNSFYTPNLKSFEFSGYLKAKVHFVKAPSYLLKATIRIWGDSWPLEYYSAMRDFLESFNCSKEVKLHIQDAEGVIIPERCRREWSSPMHSIKRLQLYYHCSLPADKVRCFCHSVLWMAPSADIWMAPSADIQPF